MINMEYIKEKKKPIIITCIIIAIVLIISFIAINNSKDNEINSKYRGKNIPSEYIGTWINYDYYRYKDYADDTTYSLIIEKNFITLKQGSNSAKIKYEIDNGDLIVSPPGNEMKFYLIVDEDRLYSSTDKTIDKSSSYAVKKNSKAENIEKMNVILKKYTENLEYNFLEWEDEIAKLDEDTYIYIEKEELDEDQIRKNEKDLNTYYAKYSLGYKKGTIEVEMNKNTQKISKIIYENSNITDEESKDIADCCFLSSIYIVKLLNNNSKQNIILRDEKSNEYKESVELYKKILENNNSYRNVSDNNVSVSYYYTEPTKSKYSSYSISDGKIRWNIYVE